MPAVGVKAEDWMNRIGLIVALGIAVVAGLIFGIYPDLDLRVARHFFLNADLGSNVFPWRYYPPLMQARDFGLRVSAVLVAPAIVALVLKLILPHRKMLISGRAVLFLIATMVIGPGLLVNLGLKDHWGRPRPIDVTQFGGDQHFVAWWDPRGDCPKNCSFVSGDVAGAAWTLAPAALAPPQWHALAYGAALALTAGMATYRVMAGGHFVSDTIFAGVFTFLIVWLFYQLIYRWPRTQLTDRAIEGAIERLARPGYDFVVGLFGKRKKPGRGTRKPSRKRNRRA
jgi:membrane-associated PAP2 superfamily phosphatase